MDAIFHLLSPLAIANDGLLIGLGLGCAAIRMWVGFISHRKAYKEVKAAPVVEISRLPDILQKVLSQRSTSPDQNDDMELNKFSSSVIPSVQLSNFSFLAPRRPYGLWPDEYSKSTATEIFESMINHLKYLSTKKQSRTNQLVITRGQIQVRDHEYPHAISKFRLQKSDYCDAPAVIVENVMKPLYVVLMKVVSLNLASEAEDIVITRNIVPFALGDKVASSVSPSPFVFISLKGSNQPLPTSKVHSKITFPQMNLPSMVWQHFWNGKMRVAAVEEESILPANTDVTAVGYLEQHSSGKPELRAAPHIPFFLSKLSPEQLIVGMAMKTKVQLLLSVLVTGAAVSILAYSALRNWRRWKDNIGRIFQGVFRGDSGGGASAEQAREQAGVEGEITVQAGGALVNLNWGEDVDEVAEGERCVVCLTRRRRTLFVGCCHRVCCSQCAMTVVSRDARCPVCRQQVQLIYRIFDA